MSVSVTYIFMGLLGVVLLALVYFKFAPHFNKSSVEKGNPVYRPRGTIQDPKYGVGEIIEREDLDDEGKFNLTVDVGEGIHQNLKKFTYHESEVVPISKPQVICDANGPAWQVIRTEKTDALKKTIRKKDEAVQDKTQLREDFDSEVVKEKDRLVDVSKGSRTTYHKPTYGGK